MRSGSVVADLKKDYFLLCKKENLARTQSTKKNTRVTSVEHAASCSESHINSPTSPCVWSMGLSRLQLDSVFDGDGNSATDDADSKEVSR